MEFYLADKQGITRAGLMYVIGQMEGCSCKYVEDKCELLQVLSCDEASVVVLDYTLLDLSEEELLILSQRFTRARFILFSDQLSTEFLRRMLYGSQSFSVMLKDDSMNELVDCLHRTASGFQYVCPRILSLVENGDVTGGMIPKLLNCAGAIESGVHRVHILDGRTPHCLLLEIFTNKGIGTAILRDAEEKYYKPKNEE